MIQPSSSRGRGFTLIELMVTVALLAILVALAAPSFRQMIEMQRLRGAHDQLSTDIQFARSEAARLKIPVHVAVQAASSPAAACYILFSDQGVNGSTKNFSDACDCSQPAGARCTAATTAEVKTVTLESFTGVDLTSINQSRFGFDPGTGAMLVGSIDGGGPPQTEFIVDVSLDSARKLRTHVGFSGKVRNCAPAGSSVKAVPC